MSNKSRRHGIFAVSGDVVALPTMNREEVRNAITIDTALETVFKQMKIGGNRERTIQSYDYIFKQFVEVNKLCIRKISNGVSF